MDETPVEDAGTSPIDVPKGMCPVCQSEDIPLTILGSHIQHCAEEELQTGVKSHCCNMFTFNKQFPYRGSPSG